MSESKSENPQPQDGENKNQTPSKRTPSKRRSMIEKAQRESEELIKNMGISLDVEGGRKTRSSTRGTTPATPVTPSPAKKPRTQSSTPSRRGRQRKIYAEDEQQEKKLETTEEEVTKSPQKVEKSTPEKQEKNVENCKNADVNDEKAKTKEKDTEKNEDGKTEVDSKMNSIAKVEKMDVIEEEKTEDKNTTSNLVDEKEQQKPTTAITKESSDTIKNSAIIKDKDEKIEQSETKTTKNVPETTKQQQLDKVEPMDVDGVKVSPTKITVSSPESKKITTLGGTTAIQTASPTTIKASATKPEDVKSSSTSSESKDLKKECTEESKTQSIKENALNDSVEKKCDVKTSPVKGNDTVAVGANVLSKDKQYKATDNVHENSISEKQQQQQSSTEYLSSENKIEESNKSGNDVCEPKISTSPKTSEVVAAQPCN